MFNVKLNNIVFHGLIIINQIAEMEKDIIVELGAGDKAPAFCVIVELDGAGINLFAVSDYPSYFSLSVIVLNLYEPATKQMKLRLFLWL